MSNIKQIFSPTSYLCDIWHRHLFNITADCRVGSEGGSGGVVVVVVIWGEQAMPTSAKLLQAVRK